MASYQSDSQKIRTVLEKNTFFFSNEVYEEKNEAYVSSLIQSILLLKQRVDSEGLKKEIFVKFIREKDLGLKAVLAILGFSDESLYRLITFMRLSNDRELNKLVNRENWPKGEVKGEWKEEKILSLARENKKIAEGIVNLFFEGSTIPIIRNSLPLFEYKKLDITKLNFTLESLIDTIIRYKIKGSYAASPENNPEAIVASTLSENKIRWQKGNRFRNIVGRDIDFLIPNRKDPIVFIESSYLETTSSGMGDKASNEKGVRNKILRKFGKDRLFIGFIDGIGWFVRKSDLKTLVGAFDDVFTFHRKELERFVEFLRKTLPKNCFEGSDE